MDALLSIKPGLIIWSLVNFLIFFFLLAKFGAKPIANALKAREDKINGAIAAAEQANKRAEQILTQSQEKLDAAQNEVAVILTKGREQADIQIRKASEEADKVKREKIDEAAREIERSKDAAIKQLRNEVASLVVIATEKILDEKLDKDRDYKLIDKYIEHLPKN